MLTFSRGFGIMVRALLLFSLVGLVLTGFLFSRRSPSRAAEADPALAPPTEDAEGVIQVGAVRLWKDYDANAVAADNQYKDRTVRVTGRVLAIERPFGDLVTLDLAGGNPIFHTMASLDTTEAQRAAELAKGDLITVQCTGGGAMMRMPLLQNCMLLRQIKTAER